MITQATEGTNSPTIPETVTTAQARKALGGISRATEYRWNKSGVLKPVYIVGRKLYRAEDIRDLIEGGSTK